MSSTVFRSGDPEPPVHIPGPDPVKNNVAGEESFEDIEPINEREKRNGDIVLETLGIDDATRNLPEEDQANLKEVKDYVLEVIKTRGLKENHTSFKKVFEEIREEMGLDPDAEPSIILDRIGGVMKSWKSLTFVKDPGEKRRIFMKLARAQDSKEMNRIIFDTMNNYQVWQ